MESDKRTLLKNELGQIQCEGCEYHFAVIRPTKIYRDHGFDPMHARFAEMGTSWLCSKCIEDWTAKADSGIHVVFGDPVDLKTHEGRVHLMPPGAHNATMMAAFRRWVISQSTSDVPNRDVFEAGWAARGVPRLNESIPEPRKLPQCEGCRRPDRFVRPVTFSRSGCGWVTDLCGGCLKEHLVAGVDIARVGEHKDRGAACST